MIWRKAGKAAWTLQRHQVWQQIKEAHMYQAACSMTTSILKKLFLL